MIIVIAISILVVGVGGIILAIRFKKKKIVKKRPISQDNTNPT